MVYIVALATDLHSEEETRVIQQLKPRITRGKNRTRIGREFSLRLLSWYETNGSMFPWRKTRNPYRTWLAEVLLQRTRSDMVSEQYEKIVSFFPNTRRLRNASLGKIRQAISSLGLPRRAHHLKRAASYLEKEYGGKFPRQVERLRELPGTGYYTANAVALFAF